MGNMVKADIIGTSSSHEADGEMPAASEARTWRRFAARGSDLVIECGAVILLGYAAYSEPKPELMASVLYWSALFGGLALIAIQIALLVRCSAMLGKRVFGIRIVRESGMPAGPTRLLLREFLILNGVGVGWTLVTLLVHGRPYYLHDSIFGTTVVKPLRSMAVAASVS